MKILLQNGESVVIVTPFGAPSSARVALQTDHHSIATMVIEDGLIGDIQEHVSRRHPPRPVEDRLTLWAHLVSEHCSVIGLDMSLEDLIKGHEHEHTGPGTIRNHPRESREAQLPKILLVLSESDHYGIPRMSINELRRHLGGVNREIDIRLRSGDAAIGHDIAAQDRQE